MESNPIQEINSSSAYVCTTCLRHFAQKRNLIRHLKTHIVENNFCCETCGKCFNRFENLKRHVKVFHISSSIFTCDQCGVAFANEDKLKEHLIKHIYPCDQCSDTFTLKSALMRHKRVKHTPFQTFKRKNDDCVESQKRHKRDECVKDVFSTHKINPNVESSEDLLIFFNEVRTRMYSILQDEMLVKHAIKWYALVNVRFVHTTIEGEMQSITTHFRSKCFIELTEDSLDMHISEAHEKMKNSFEQFTRTGSGWTLDKIQNLEIFIAQYQPLAASSYLPLPSYLMAKKAILNVQNSDNKCFLWCLLAHKLNLNRNEHPERVSNYISYEDLFNMKNVEFPVKISQIPLIEKQNSICINVYGYQDKKIFPIYISSQEENECIHLLLISDEEKQHFCLIRDLSRLVSSRSKHNGATFVCFRCLHCFTRADLLKEHLFYCKDHTPQHIKMPNAENNILKFINIHYQHPIPYITYADFEAFIQEMPTVDPNASQSYTSKIAHHEPCGYAYIIVGPNGKSLKPISVYRGPQTVDHFLKNIIREKNELAPKLANIVPMHMTKEDEESFKAATHCFICQKAFLNSCKVRDHCHSSGKYRGALHNYCNLQYKMRKMIPVVFHNLKHYDAHHIMSGLGKFKDHTINVILTNMEKYISFSISQKYEGVDVSLQFIDSFQFLNSSLEKLVTNLTEDQFKILKENIPHHTDLLLRKGIYPYEYMSAFSKFAETSLPPPNAFTNTLTGHKITEEEYAYAQTVWKTFGIRNMGEYHDLYVKSDVLQLADVFENFRKLCVQHYELDCGHLLTAPGLAWNACLKMTGEPLELLTDIEMYLFIEKGIRGGISMISKRLACANNKYLENYDPEKPQSHILYLDANNLYGWAMSQTLPYGGFQWVTVENVTEEWVQSLQDDGPIGFIFEVDLEYPTHLHDSHNDYPLAPERLKITREMLSPYAENILIDSHFTSSEKLSPNLNDKKNYIVYYKNLKFYLAQGLKLTKVHKVLKFKQKAWLKSYIDYNTEQRENATSTFAKDFFKLMNNSVYGKTMENLRKRVDVQLVHSIKKAKKLVACPSFNAFTLFNEDLVGIKRLKKTLTLNRPIYVGFVILELRKILMYNFHYNYIKKQYHSNAHLLFTDTDSLTYHIYTKDIYEDMKKDQHLFDTSDYPKSHPLHSLENKKKIGLFKDELNSKPIYEFVGLRAKMYSILSSEGEKKTAKGVSRYVISNNVKHDHYKKCLETCKHTREVQTSITSEKHQLFTTRLNKIALSPFDDKRYLLEDGIHSLAYGHHAIMKKK